jgi:hypothetical protein
MSDTSSPPTREQADAEFSKLLEAAEHGQLGPADFKRADELLPHVSPELKQ